MEARNLTQAPLSHNELHGILDDAQVDPKDCYQCGKCSAGCPVASDADMTPREVLRHLQLGQIKPVLESNMPWLCAGCGMCLARCPQSVDLPNLMLACRRAAEAQGVTPIGEVAHFNQLFVDGVREKGISDETILAMRFNLTTGHFLQDALSAPKMVVRGMLGPTSKEQANADEVKELIDRARIAASQNTPSAEKEA